MNGQTDVSCPLMKVLCALTGLVIAGLFVQPTPQARQSVQTRIDVSQLGPQIGERVPDFSLPDQVGRMRTLESIMGPRGAMLVFIRSADW